MVSSGSESNQASVELDESGVPLLQGQGETEEDLESNNPAEFKASLSASDWTVETIISQMRKGRIDLNPKFQRRNAWIDTRKSRLIESVILRYPIPQIVLAERADKPGNYFVIDGKQRLLALRQFAANMSTAEDSAFEPLELTGLQVLTDLNGMNMTSLQEQEPDLFTAFENHTIRTVFLSNWTSTDLLLSLFLRLNTGSVTLSPQELRQALHPGPFIDWVDDSSLSSLGLRRLLGHDAPDRRMVDAELLLRHLALRFSPVSYKGSLKTFLDSTTRAFNSDWERWEPVVSQGLIEMESAISAVEDVFTRSGTCRKWTKDHWERALNRAVFDIMMLSFVEDSLRHRTSAPDVRAGLVAGFQSLCDTNPSFAQAITSTTKTASAFRNRIEPWFATVQKVAGVTCIRPASIYGPE